MKLYNTLIDLLAEMKDRDREIRFIDGEHDESVIHFGELWERALALLGSLQARGMSPGDELIIFSKSNESFVVAFWAAVLGGIVPVPVAVGVSDEHKLKLFRILSQLQNPTLFTEMDLLQRLHDHEIDAALLATPVEDSRFGSIPLFDEPFWVAYPRKHNFYTRERITLRDLQHLQPRDPGMISFQAFRPELVR